MREIIKRAERYDFGMAANMAQSYILTGMFYKEPFDFALFDKRALNVTRKYNYKYNKKERGIYKIVFSRQFYNRTSL